MEQESWPLLFAALPRMLACRCCVVRAALTPAEQMACTTTTRLSALVGLLASSVCVQGNRTAQGT